MTEKYQKKECKPCLGEILNQVKTKINYQALQNSRASIIPLIKSVIEKDTKTFNNELEQILEYLDDMTYKKRQAVKNQKFPCQK